MLGRLLPEEQRGPSGVADRILNAKRPRPCCCRTEWRTKGINALATTPTERCPGVAAPAPPPQLRPKAGQPLAPPSHPLLKPHQQPNPALAQPQDRGRGCATRGPRPQPAAPRLPGTAATRPIPTVLQQHLTHNYRRRTEMNGCRPRSVSPSLPLSWPPWPSPTLTPQGVSSTLRSGKGWGIWVRSGSGGRGRWPHMSHAPPATSRK